MKKEARSVEEFVVQVWGVTNVWSVLGTLGSTVPVFITKLTIFLQVANLGVTNLHVQIS